MHSRPTRSRGSHVKAVGPLCFTSKFLVRRGPRGSCPQDRPQAPAGQPEKGKGKEKKRVFVYVRERYYSTSGARLLVSSLWRLDRDGACGHGSLERAYFRVPPDTDIYLYVYICIYLVHDIFGSSLYNSIAPPPGPKNMIERSSDELRIGRFFMQLWMKYLIWCGILPGLSHYDVPVSKAFYLPYCRIWWIFLSEMHQESLQWSIIYLLKLYLFIYLEPWRLVTKEMEFLFVGGQGARSWWNYSSGAHVALFGYDSRPGLVVLLYRFGSRCPPSFNAQYQELRIWRRHDKLLVQLVILCVHEEKGI